MAAVLSDGHIGPIKPLKQLSIMNTAVFKGPKYREPRSFTWKQNSKLFMDSVEDYALRWVKQDCVVVDNLSE